MTLLLQKYSFMILQLLFSILISTTPTSSEEVLKNMHNRYYGKWYKTLTFTQKNEFYKSDTVTGTSIWYEAIEFPDKFRIDIGDLKDGNAAILANDSIYRFKGGELVNQSYRKNDLTFLGGGMFFLSWKDVLSELSNLGYDITKGYKKYLNDREVFIIGVDNPADNNNQLWVDLENLYVIRVITYKNGKKTEAIYEEHQPIGDGWTETKVTFNINDELVQVEYYSDCKANEDLPEVLFDPSSFGKVHWMKD